MQDELPRASSHESAEPATGGILYRLKPNDGPYFSTSMALTTEQREVVRELAERHRLSQSLIFRLLLDDALTAGEAIVAEAMAQSTRRMPA